MSSARRTLRAGRSLFINLPVADTAASKAFYVALGFSHNPNFSDDGTTCIVISEHLYVMAMERARFQGFIEGEIAPAGTVEVLNTLSCDSREEVDQLVTKALDAGGRPWKPTNDLGRMYGGSFQDPDGHVWEVVWMDPAALTGGATEQTATALPRGGWNRVDELAAVASTTPPIRHEEGPCPTSKASSRPCRPPTGRRTSRTPSRAPSTSRNWAPLA